MAERHRSSTPQPEDKDPSVIESLKHNVTQPLTRRRDIRKYWEQIQDAQSELENGLIRDVHEFELVLISRNKVIASGSGDDCTVTES